MRTLTKSVTVLFLLTILAGCIKDDVTTDSTNKSELKSADTRSVNFEWTSEYAGPLICNDEIVDILYIPEDVGATAHATSHMANGKLVWLKVHFNLTITSQMSGEIYRVIDQTTATFDENSEMDKITWHIHAKGDKGTQVNLFFAYDPATEIIDFLRGVCP